MSELSRLTRAEILAHADALREALAAWPPPEGPGSGREAEAAAFEIAANAGMLHRYTGKSEPLDCLAAWPRAERRALALDAAAAFDTAALAARLDALAEEDFPDEGDIARVEQALLRRDLIDAALDALNRVCADMLPEGDAPDLDVGDAIGQAWRQAAALDEAFERAGPVTLAAMPIFDGLKQAIVIDDALRRWWFADGPAQLAAEDDAFTAALFPGGRASIPSARDIVGGLLDALSARSRSGSALELAGANSAPSLERELRGPGETMYFEIGLEGGPGYVCRVYGAGGARLPDAAALELAVVGDGGDLAVWPFDASGTARVEEFPAGPARRLLVRRREGGAVVGEVHLDD